MRLKYLLTALLVCASTAAFATVVKNGRNTAEPKLEQSPSENVRVASPIEGQTVVRQDVQIGGNDVRTLILKEYKALSGTTNFCFKEGDVASMRPASPAMP